WPVNQQMRRFEHVVVLVIMADDVFELKIVDQWVATGPAFDSAGLKTLVDVRVCHRHCAEAHGFCVTSSNRNLRNAEDHVLVYTHLGGLSGRGACSNTAEAL